MNCKGKLDGGNARGRARVSPGDRTSAVSGRRDLDSGGSEGRLGSEWGLGRGGEGRRRREE